MIFGWADVASGAPVDMGHIALMALMVLREVIGHFAKSQKNSKKDPQDHHEFGKLRQRVDYHSDQISEIKDVQKQQDAKISAIQADSAKTAANISWIMDGVDELKSGMKELSVTLKGK